jgi:hypothetical protein
MTAQRARQLHGPGLAQKTALAKPEPSPFDSNDAPLKVTFSPDVDPTDPAIRIIVALSSWPQIDLLLPPPLDKKIPSPPGFPLLYEPIKGHEPDGWGLEIPGYASWRRAIHIQTDFPAVAEEFFGKTTKKEAFYLFAALQAHREIPADLLVTANNVLLSHRDSAGFLEKLGIVTPREALAMVFLFFRHRRLLPIKPTGNVTVRVMGGAIYEGFTQLLMPNYLRLYAHLADLGENHDDDRSYLEGLLINVTKTLIALDRLAVSHVSEASSGANNDTVRFQQYEASNLVVSVTGALEGLTWLLVGLAAAKPKRKREVSFPALVSGQKDWIARLGTMSAAAGVAVKEYAPVLRAIYAMRHTIQHHLPIPTSVGQFGEILKTSEGERFFADFKMGLLHSPSTNKPEGGWPLGAPGVLEDLTDDRGMTIVPYPFFREGFHLLVTMLDDVLEELCAALKAPPLTTGLPYAVEGGDPVLLGELASTL